MKSDEKLSLILGVVFAIIGSLMMYFALTFGENYDITWQDNHATVTEKTTATNTETATNNTNDNHNRPTEPNNE